MAYIQFVLRSTAIPLREKSALALVGLGVIATLVWNAFLVGVVVTLVRRMM